MKRLRSIDPDSPESTLRQREILCRKTFLRSVYRWYYSFYEAAVRLAPPGRVLEIGSGAGFAEEYIPGLIRSDVQVLPHVDVVCAAEQLPFAAGSLSAVFCLNVLHHIRCPELFFSEIQRCLVPGGRVTLLEPYIGPFSRYVYRYLHHEPYDFTSREWRPVEGGALTGANLAMSHLIFIRDRERFTREFPLLHIHRILPHTKFIHWLSGGLNFPQVMPDSTFQFWLDIERRFRRIDKYLAMMMTIDLYKASGVEGQDESPDIFPQGAHQ